MASGMKGKVKAGEEFQQYFNKQAKTGTEKLDFYWEVENGVLPVLPPVLEMEQRIAIALFRKDDPSSTGFVPVHPEIFGARVVPGVVVAPPKSTIKFHNADPFVHELYSDDLGKLFPPELQSSQQTRQVQFTNPGVYRVSCRTTPHLAGYVVIVEGVVAVKTPDAEGNFSFEEMDPGDYIVKIYFDGSVVGEKAVTVVDSDKEKDIAQVEIEMKPPALAADGPGKGDGKTSGKVETKAPEDVAKEPEDQGKDEKKGKGEK